MATFCTFLIAYVLSQFYRSFLAVIAPELAQELALDPQALANMQAWWVAGFVLMQFPVGWALDVIGPRRTVSTLMLAAVAGAVLFANAHAAIVLDVAMALIGVGCASIYMGAIFVFGRVNPPEQFALLCSWLLGMGSAGNLLAASPLALAAETFGWRAAMLVIAGATVLSALSVLLFIRDPGRLIAHRGGGFFSGLAEILSLRAIWPLLPLTAISYAVILSERGLWAGPYFAEVFRLEPLSRGNALLIMAAAMSAGAMIYGPLDRVFGTRKWIVVTGTALSAAFLLTLSLADLHLSAAIIVMAALGASAMTYGVLMAHGRSFFPDHLLGRGITAMNVLFLGGAGVLQPLSGAIMTSQHNNGIAPAAAFSTLHLVFAGLLLAALAIYLFSRERPVAGAAPV